MAPGSWISRITRPTSRVVRALALTVLVTQVLISVTGSIVRATGSGLGCPTWPQCFPGSLVPQAHPEVATLHKVIEFGNRTLTGVVGFIALACLLAAWLRRPYRRRLVGMALIMPLGVLVQAVIGGMTVKLSLAWWSVSLHFMASAVLVWLATHLVKTASEGDEQPYPLVPTRIRRLLIALTAITPFMLIAGTIVTAAGPHAGDEQTARLPLPIPALTETHALLVTAYVCVLAVLGVWLRNTRPTKAFVRVYGAACVVVLAQGALGLLQYFLGVPGAMVVGHVLGAMLVVITNALLWSESRYRAQRHEHSAPVTANEREVPA